MLYGLLKHAHQTVLVEKSRPLVMCDIFFYPGSI